MSNIAPGVYWKEYSLSNYAPTLSSTIYAVVGTATKGQINKRTLITTTEELVKTFGYPADEHFAVYAALDYLRAGNQLWFVRVESQATPAVVAEATLTLQDTTTAPVQAKDAGTYYNNLRLKVTHDTPRRQNFENIGTDFSGTGPYILDLSGEPLLVANTIQVYEAGTLVLTDDGAGTLTGLAGYAGTVDYLTGDISLSFTNDPGAQTVTVKTQYYSAFSIEVIKTIEAKEYVMETFGSMDLVGTSADYYATILESSFLLQVPTFSSFPQVGTYPISGGTDGLASIDFSDYIGQEIGGVKTGLQLFSVPEEVDINTISVPGIVDSPVINATVSLAAERADCIALVDPPKALDPQEVVDWVDGKNEYASQNAINSSYAAIYYPWIRIWDAYNDEYKLIPPSGFAAAAFARTARFWDAPAGVDAGKLHGVDGMERILSAGDRKYLYKGRINPVNDFAASGVMIYGQKTSQVESDALDRLNVRRLLTHIEKVAVTAVQPYVFKPNNLATWEGIKQTLQPYLDSLIAQGALESGEVVCDGNTNTAEVIGRNELIANIFLVPTKTAEVITLNFIHLPTGATISEYVGRQF